MKFDNEVIRTIQPAPVRASHEVFNCVVLIIISLAILLSFVSKIGHGFDFSDEGYYANLIANPSFYQPSTTQFGFVYHGLYELVNHDLISMRIFGVLTTFVLPFVVVFTYTASLESRYRLPLLGRGCLSLSFATLGLAFYSLWLVTPNYNLLTFQGLLITAIGVNLGAIKKSQLTYLSAALVGLGGCITFLGKPSSAAALGLVTGCTLLILRVTTIRYVSIAIVCAAFSLFVSSTLISGGPAEFFGSLRVGLALQDAAQAGHDIGNIFRWDRLSPSNFEQLFMVAWTTISAAAIISSTGQTRLSRWVWTICGSVFLAVAMTAFVTQTILPHTGLQFLGLQALGTTFASCLALVVAMIRGFVTPFLPRRGILIIFYLFMPFVFAFGTNNNYWSQSSHVCFFFALPAVSLLMPVITAARNFGGFVPLALSVETLALVIVHSGYQFPYRQPAPLALQNTEARVGSTFLKLSPDAAAYIHSAQSVAEKNGFIIGTPILDLSGMSPGLIYAVGGTGVGSAWLDGLYPGSYNVARMAILYAGCARASQAWILTEDGGPRELSKNLISLYGANFETDFFEVGSWRTTGGVSGRTTDHVQRLFRPVDPKAIRTRCSISASRTEQ